MGDKEIENWIRLGEIIQKPVAFGVFYKKKKKMKKKRLQSEEREQKKQTSSDCDMSKIKKKKEPKAQHALTSIARDGETCTKDIRRLEGFERRYKFGLYSKGTRYIPIFFPLIYLI